MAFKQNGTTTVSSFCTSSSISVNQFLKKLIKEKRKSLETILNAPNYLLDTVNSSYDDSKKLIEKWHKKTVLYILFLPDSHQSHTQTVRIALAKLRVRIF